MADTQRRHRVLLDAELVPAEVRVPVLRAMLRDTLTYTVPTMLSQGLALILLPIYARVLTRDEFGALDLLLSIAPIVTIVVSLEIAQGLARLRADADEEERRRMTGTAWVAATAGFLVFVLIGLTAADPLGLWVFGRHDFADTVRLGVLSVTATGLYGIVVGQFRWELRSRTYAVVSSLYAAVTVGLTVLMTVGGSLGLSGVLLAQTIAATAVAVVSLVLLRNSWRPVIDRDMLRRMLAFSLPLIPASLCVLLTLSFNRMALRAFGDLEDVAAYGMAARLAGFVGLLVVGMQSAVTPLVYQHYRESGTPRQLAHLFSGVVAVCVVVCVALNAFSADLTVAFAGRDYLSSAPLIALIAPALLLGQLYVFAPGMGIALRTRAQLGVAATAAAVDVFANLVLIPEFGALGAAVAALVSSAIFLGVWVAVSQRYYRVPFEGGRLALGLGLFAVGSVAAIAVRAGTEPLAPTGLLLKVVVVLGCLALLHRVGLFDGVLAGLRERATPATDDRGTHTTG